MVDAAVNLFDDLTDVTQEEVAEAKRRSLLEKGYYSAAITKITPKVAASGQAMLIVEYAPCSTPENPKTQSFKHKLTHFFMLPWLKDQEGLRAAIAGKRNTDPAVVTDEEVADAWEERKARALLTFVSDVRVLLGDESDLVPTKKELVQSGRAAGYDEANIMSINLAKEAVQAIANGNVDLTGFTRVLYVTQSTYRNEPCNNVARVMYSLPEGQQFTEFSSY